MITVRDSAQDKIREILEANAPPGGQMYLRIYITGGGCSGFQYNFTMDEVKNPEEDMEFEFPGFVVLVDSMSLQYLDNAEIDFREDIYGASFSINNPQAATTCGCGNSFSV